MRVTEFLQKNIAWNIHKNIFEDLCCTATTEEQLMFQLQRLAEKYFPQRKKVDTIFTEFCLNRLALDAAKTDTEKCVKHHFNGYWQTFLRLKAVFAKDFMTLPSDGKRTRLEYIAELIARCTQFALNDAALAKICQRVCEIFDLEDREARNVENVVELYKVNYFCAVSQAVFCHNPNAETRLAKLLDAHPLKTEFSQNNFLRHAYFCTKHLVANVDCLANSATKFNVPTAVDVKPYFYVNGKNVFDTFCFSKFGKHTAEFYSQNASVKVELQYFLEGNREVRRYTVTNNGKGKKNLVTDFLLRHMNPSDKTAFFNADGALCLSVDGNESFYCALAIVFNNKILPCAFEEGRLSYQFAMSENDVLQFDTVTVFAENMPLLADELSALNCYGATRCPYVCDVPSNNIVQFKYPLNTTSHGYTKRQVPPKEATTLNFTYQLGNDNVGTFLDNAGNCTTLLNGFAFGVSGEKVYSVRNGAISQINCDRFSLNNDSIIYKKHNAVCTVLHTDAKTYNVQYETPVKTLFYFPLEEKCQIDFDGKTFTVSGDLRKFTIQCHSKVESYTTNALECNPERLRYKLSGEMKCGSCLAICFATAENVQVTIASLSKIAKPQPLVRESLVSTYLNYVNNKNVFCLNNYLKRADSLTLAAINFTNPQFVKDYVTNVFNRNVFYYDVTGRAKRFYDRLAMPLAVVYYTGMNDDANFPSEELKQYIKGIMFNESFGGKDLCVKALLLKKAAALPGFDKVRCLIEYNTVKKLISNDPKLYAYAQAIGAVPMLHPSKERLKDLCNRYDIPKSWYYVSQLENLYGFSFIGGVLNFSPKVTQENVLEQLALNIAGKRIETSFAKSTVQSMTLNGVQYFIPFKPQSLKSQNNTLVVRY